MVWWTSSQHDEGIPNHADAYRIVAAVNACEGISTEALEAGVVADILDALQEFCRRVEAGEIRSKRTYAAFKAMIARATGEAKP